MEPNRVPELVEHLFRRQAGLMTAVLTRIFGAAHMGLVEDVVQDALVRALEVWPLAGTPANPSAWLIQVAKNRALDVVRRQAHFSTEIKHALLALQPESLGDADSAFVAGACADDVLAMLFLCCHPDIAFESRVALSLKVVAGLSTQEVARGLMTQEGTVAQRIVRAKQQIRNRAISLEMPLATELPRRLESVLEVLYLWFNEGHLARDGEALVRDDLCHEALRLARLVAAHPITATPQAHALAALMAFHAARLPARVGSEGELLLLRDQDRSIWDRNMLDQGFLHLAQCAQGLQASSFHFEAGIAACHAAAPAYEYTDWPTIVHLYGQLHAVNPSPVVQLNRAIAVSRLQGPGAGIALILPLLGDTRLARYHVLWAVLGELSLEAGALAEARTWFARALQAPCSAPERRHLQSRLLLAAG
jgi:RNA polymerase sigma factor (sigma-70 family)